MISKKNKVLYVLILLCLILFLIKKNIGYFVGLSSDFYQFFNRPYTLILYAFFHQDFKHLFFNMCLLYFVGVLFLRWFSVKYFIIVFTIGIIFCGLSFLLISHLQDNDTVLLGISGGIMVLFFFLTSYFPLIPVSLFLKKKIPLWVFAFLFFVLDVLQILFFSRTSNWVHLSGVFCGVLLFLVDRFYFQKYKTENKKIRKSKKIKQMSLEDIQTQREIDIILKKITQSGYESLSDAEKKYMFQLGSSIKKKYRNS